MAIIEDEALVPTPGQWFPDYPPSVFTRHEDGTITINQFYQYQRFEPALLGLADPAVIETRITITAANGKAVYRVVGLDGDNLVCAKVEG